MVERSFTEVAELVRSECKTKQKCSDCILSCKDGCRFVGIVNNPNEELAKNNINAIFEIFGMKE